MKLTKSKNLTGLVLAVLMALPLFSIASRVIYVQANKNAYHSYYGETINETTFTNNLNTLSVNNDYEINITEMPSSQQTSQYIYVDRIYDLEGIPTSSTYYTEIPNATAFSLYHNSNLNSYSLRYTYNNETKYYGFATVPSNALNPFTFKFEISADYQNTNTDLQKYIYKMTYNKDSYLDNVFEYSVSQFVKDNDFGNVDLFSYFGNIFLNDSQMNNLYVGFANWYLNYAMLITLMHFLFAILMWFINYSRRILDRSMNYDW